HNAQRFDLVDRRVRRIAPTAEAVEQHLARELASQAGLKRTHRRTGPSHRRPRGDWLAARRRLVEHATLAPAAAPGKERGPRAHGARLAPGAQCAPDGGCPMPNAPRRSGRHFLQIPGPTPVPDRILRAMAMPVIDHRGPEFKRLALRVLAGLKTVFKTSGEVFIYPASGTGAWEAALANTLSPGDRVLMFETGHFATLWRNMAERLGLVPEFIASDWRGAADPKAIEARLREDARGAIKAVCIVHNETSTGATSPIAAIRRAIDAAGHPALLMVDTISSL